MANKKASRFLPLTGQKTHKCEFHPEVTLRVGVGRNGCWRCAQHEEEPAEIGLFAQPFAFDEGAEDLELY